jgi:hypothetical protein
MVTGRHRGHGHMPKFAPLAVTLGVGVNFNLAIGLDSPESRPKSAGAAKLGFPGKGSRHNSFFASGRSQHRPFKQAYTPEASVLFAVGAANRLTVLTASAIVDFTLANLASPRCRFTR